MKIEFNKIAVALTVLVILVVVTLAIRGGGTRVVIEKQAQVDGKISAGEYPNYYKNIGINMEVYWTIHENQIYFGLVAPAKGWVAIGLDPDDAIKTGADIIIGYVENGSVTIYDSYSYSTTAHAPDTTLGGTDDILEYAGSESDTGTVLEFKRNFYTGDNFDKPITGGTHNLLIGYASVDNIAAYHSTNRAELNINFFTGEV